MRTNTPRLWFLSAGLPMLILNLSFAAQSAYATTEADTIQHQPNKAVQKSHSMSVYNRTTSTLQDHPIKTTKPHSLIQKRVKPEAQGERAPLGSQADETVSPLRRAPSPSPFASPSASSLNAQAVPHAAIPFTSTLTLAPTTPTQSPALIPATNVVPAPSAKSGGMEAAAALHTLRAAASTLSGHSSNVSEPPAPRRRLQFEMPTLTQSFKPAHAEQPPAIGASPLSFSFTAEAGGSAPAPQMLTIQNTGGGVLTWTTSDNAPWLTLSLASGINNGTVLVSVEPGTLTLGTYMDTITVSAADSVPITIPITFTITSPPVTPAIGATPLSVTLTAQEKSSTTASQSVTIRNTGGGTLTWTASETETWLSLSPASGTDTGTITVTATAGSLTPGTYSTSVNVSAPGATTKAIPVSFTITPAPAIGATPLSVTLTAQEKSSTTASQSVTIRNTGGGTLTWTASETETWLSLSPASGTDTGTITVTATAGSLTPGTYSTSVNVSAPGATTKAISVTFTVSTAPVPPAIGANPLSISLTTQQNSTTAVTQSVSISNTGGGTLTWTANASPATPWLSLSPASGTDTGTITVTATAGSLTPGTYNTSVNLSAPGTTAKAIPVSFTITPAPAIGATPLSVTLTAQESSSTAVSQFVTVSNTGGGTLTWTASETAPWLSLSPTSGTGTGTIKVTATAGSLTPGTYSTSVNVSAPGATAKAIPVSFTITPAPAIGATPLSVTLTTQQNSSTAVTQSIVISNTGGGTLTWTASETETWLSLSPSSGTGTGTITVSATAGSLTPGTYSTSLNVSAPGATAKAILVTLIVTPSSPTTKSATLTWTANGETDLAGYKIYRATSSGAYGAPIVTLGPTTSYIATNLSVGTTYFFVITAYDSAGNESFYSNEVSKSIY